MRIYSWFLTLLLSAVAAPAFALSTPKPGDIVEVALEQLHPTQAVVGFDQIYYKLGRFAKEPSRVFDEYCETNGQGEATRVTSASELNNAASFECQSPPGTRPSDMKTVVVGPAGQLYLTDGHHTFSTLWEQKGGGPRLKMWVRVTDDFSASADSAAFWQQMEQGRKVWLRDARGQPIAPAQLPAHLGLKALADDPFRSLVYFARDAAYGKPASGTVAPEFLEFYWGNWLRSQVDLKAFNLDKRAGYQDAVEACAQLIVKLSPQDPVGDSGFSASQLGGFTTLNRKQLNKTTSTKLPFMIDYKKSRD